MNPTSTAPELQFQAHIADYLAEVHGYRVLQQAEITDLEHFLVEDELWAFLQATQADTLQKLAEQYGSDTRGQVFKALRQQLAYMPLWLILREGLQVKSLELRLFYPKPRSSDSAAAGKYHLNRLSFRPHFYFGPTHKEIDLVLFLNGLPIVALEVKHDKNQNVHHAVEQFTVRDHSFKIFQHPFLYLAADTTEVMAATDPSRVEHFRWHNSGLNNHPQTDGEYPVEYLYREVLSKDQLLEALSFFLVRVPAQAADGDKPARAAYSIFPRYHQSRMVRRLADDLVQHFVANGHIGRKYLINHSAGSGKTLSMCWLADRLHSLYKPDSNQKLVDTVFILTDRKALDKNVRDDIDKFSHLKNIIGLARKSKDLANLLKQRKPIIVTTQQKFATALKILQSKPELKDLRVAFLIDEAHRSQEGAMGAAIRLPFRKPDEADSGDSETVDEEDSYAKIIREYDRNQLFVAFTATPAPVTVQLFGEAFDSYTEDEAIKEGYIVDVVDKIISYKTLYNLHCKLVPDAEEEKLYPKGVIAKALQNVAYQDEGLIQYKAEVMLRTFDEDIKPLIGGRAKAMIVTSSRLAGLRYYQIIKEKLKERGADYQVLYAFSDFVHPQTNEAISEHALNGLADAELIEDRFEGDDYRLLVVASKFQTGFDQPLLAGMFLDKVVADRNAVQTVSRLNRCYPGKDNVVVVDFTNNAANILKAFAKYRNGTPYQAKEPDPESCIQLYEQVLEQGVFSQADAEQFWALLQQSSDAAKQAAMVPLRTRFQAVLTEMEARKSYVYLLSKLVSSFHFMSCFYSYPEAIVRFAQFAAYVGPQLIKQGSVSELMKRMQQTEVIKAGVNKVGEFKGSDYTVTTKTGGNGGGGAGAPVKVSIQQVIDEIKQKFEISDEEALYIKQVTVEKAADQQIRMTVASHKLDTMFLHDAYREQINTDIRFTYNTLARFEELADPKYTDTGGIFDIMAVTVIQSHLAAVA